ncbi:hypothetical protein AXF42_Ash006001 [Apostasia shenzhenica]|uniref:Uncharacterized protein n=1 Tax=Apostasia shenzhenica TaxID=1088818 RepID=A0A2I0AZZ6_9ASPA|nr:hypothetical protein AXF42_Ash006001 [Apostasia shenzhenica]
MTRRCSHCSHNGHNSRTCPNRGVKLFGVRLTDGCSIRKSASMGNLSLLAGSASGASPADGTEAAGSAADGYASEDYAQGKASNLLVIFFPLTINLQGYRGLKRSTGCFYLACKSLGKTAEPHLFPVNHEETETQASNSLLAPALLEEECESMDSNNSVDEEAAAGVKQDIPESQCSYPVMFPAYFSPFFPFNLPPWPVCPAANTVEKQIHEIVKPTPVHSKSPINVDELLGISKLSIGEESGAESTPPLPLSLNLLLGSNRLSAFHASTPGS